MIHWKRARPWVLGGLLGLVLPVLIGAYYINYIVGVCDPTNPAHCLAIDGSGNIGISGSISASITGINSSPTGGATPYNTITLATTIQAVKASAGSLYYMDSHNPGAADCYVQFFDLAAGSVVLGTTPPNLTLWVPAGGAADRELASDARAAFLNAISIAATTTPTGSTACASNLQFNATYK